GGSAAGAKGRYAAAVRRAEALGYAYRTAADLVGASPIEDLLARFESLAGTPSASPASDALLGMADLPQTTVSEAFEIYADEIMAPELVGKSENQRKDWRKVKQRAVSNFTELIGDVPISGITRDD